MFKIGNVNIKNNVVVAPMAGVSNPAFMKICEEIGAGYAVTELISAEAVVRNSSKTFDMLSGIEMLNIPVAIQIFGSNPDTLSKAANILTDKYNVDIIDINMGCPVPKVAIRSNAGSALLKDEGKIYDIVKKVKESVNVAVTVKIRSGWDKEHINAVLVAKTCQEAGADAITIHPRTRSQGYTGKADWSIIKEVKKSVKIPVIGNGDVLDIYDAKKMIDQTGCDAVMIGRGLLGNPYLIKQVNTYFNDKKIVANQNAVEKLNTCLRHFDYLLKLKPEKVAVMQMRGHAAWYLKSLPDSSKIKTKLYTITTKDEFIKTIKEYMETLSKNMI